MLKVVSTKSEWDEVISCFDNLDIYYSKEYIDLFAVQENGRVEALFYQDDECKIFYPYIVRKIPFENYNYQDIVTAYGYGGPHLIGNQEKIKKFYELFEEYCRERNIVTETIRCHPLLCNHQYLEEVMDTNYIRKTTAVNLENSYEDIFNHYTSSNKRNIKKALKNGIVVEKVDISKENIDIFVNLYKETMDRNYAKEMYYFDADYFYNQANETSLYECYLLFAKYENQIIAGVMVLLGKKSQFSHYHLGASKTDFLHVRPNNILFDYMIKFCLKKGAKFLHLGGGYSEDDGLFKFKSSFTANNHYGYYIGSKIYDEAVYDNLCEVAAKKSSLREGYFPLYRSIL
ncbi:peptidoglycan bridge formation glycyltransferase FemA/FemB family protein [Bacillus sp. S13(2024)]|uniref:lipid II:glycine glycyltransferase FemX n=1 Tax=unclassified Bacillus (in: firmicutes) TaxID=185979 RepID=UPI003D1FD61C